MHFRPGLIVLCLPALLAMSGSARAALPPLAPRAVLFGDFAQDAPALSPDGRSLLWARRGPDGIVNLWVRALDRDTSWQVTHDTRRGVHNGFWAPDARTVLYVEDKDGDENFHVKAVPAAGGEVRDLTPFAGARAEGLITEPTEPRAILVGLNRRDPQVFDLWRVDVASGEAKLEAENPGDVIEWTADRQFRVRACTALRPHDSATILRVRDAVDAPWRDLATWSMEEAGLDRARKLLAFLDDTTLLVQRWAGGNTSRLVTMSTRDGRVLSTLASDPRCDLWNLGGGAPQVLLSADRSRVLAAAFEDLKPEWKVLDPEVGPDLEALGKLAAGGSFAVVDADREGRRWVVRVIEDRAPGRFLLWDRGARRATPLFDLAPAMRGLTLSPMQALRIPARDGLELPCYLTLPAGVPAKQLPLVLDVHGGPWWRDSWGWNPEVQWLANRGYAVLQVEFRGSTGFGLPFLNAGDHEFGPGRVLQDLVDASRWAVRRGLADPKRIGILGWSFGGYATLAGLAFAPDVFACGVDGVGPSDMGAAIASFPPYWAPRRQRWLNRWGDVVADSALNARLSPLYHVDAIRAPLLIGHGLNDPRVKIAASERIVKALRERGREVEFVVYPDEGHGFARAENNMDFYGRAERFLAKHLGGRAQPWEPVQGATAELR